MNAQLSLFDQTSAPINAISARCKVIQLFPGKIATPPQKPNYRKGGEQTVFPIKYRDQLDTIGFLASEKC